jgi:hypothetical protein
MSKPKRPWGLTLVAILLIICGPGVLLHGLGFALDGHYAKSAGGTTQGIAILATGILILVHHKSAVFLAEVCAVLFTIAALVHGLTLVDLVEVILVWVGFFWYKSWRKRVGTPIAGATSETGELAQHTQEKA